MLSYYALQSAALGELKNSINLRARSSAVGVGSGRVVWHVTAHRRYCVWAEWRINIGRGGFCAARTHNCCCCARTARIWRRFVAFHSATGAVILWHWHSGVDPLQAVITNTAVGAITSARSSRLIVSCSAETLSDTATCVCVLSCHNTEHDPPCTRHRRVILSPHSRWVCCTLHSQM